MRITIDLSDEQAATLKEAAKNEGRTVKFEAEFLFDIVLRITAGQHKQEKMTQMPPVNPPPPSDFEDFKPPVLSGFTITQVFTHKPDEND